MMRKLLYAMPKTGFPSFQWECLSFGYLHAYARAHGWEGEAQFLSALRNWDTEDEILRAGATSDLVAFYATSPQYKHACQLAADIKSENPSVGCVIGGPHASALPEVVAAVEANGKPLWDHIVVGEGEQAFLSVVREDAKERILKFPFITNVDTIPFPDRSLMRQEEQLGLTTRIDGKRIGSLFGSRACPAKCTFCSSRIVWGRNTRERSPANILDEVGMLIDIWKVDSYRFADDIFCFSQMNGQSRARDFAQEVMRRGLDGVPFECNLRGNISETDLEWLAKAGCAQVNIGVETGSEKLIREMKKGVTKDAVRRAFRKARDLGIKRRSYIILGLPGEDESTIRETWQFVEELDPEVLGFSQVAAYPGTDYFRPEFSDLDYSMIDEYGGGPMLTDRLTLEELKHWQLELSRRWEGRLALHAQQRAEELELESAANHARWDAQIESRQFVPFKPEG